MFTCPPPAGLYSVVAGSAAAAFGVAGCGGATIIRLAGGTGMAGAAALPVPAEIKVVAG